MFLGKIMPEHHGLHGGTQRLQQVFTLVGYTAGQPDDLREKDVDQVGNAYRKIMNVGIHNLLCGGIPLRCGIKSRATVHVFRLCGQHVQRTFRVGEPCFFCHADQCGCTG